MRLEGKRIIVTGAARGIGASAVCAFTTEGAHVAALDITNEVHDMAHDASRKGPGQAFAIPCDVRRREDVAEVFATAVEKLNGLDALVHAAGVERAAPAAEITDADWDLVVDVNLKGTFITNQVAFEHLREHGGSIVNFASGAAFDKYVGGGHYAASKGGVVSWTRVVAAEWGRHGIRVNAVQPAMATPMYAAHRAGMGSEELAAHDAQMATLIPLGGRLGDPDTDLAPVLVFLVSDDARFITAQILASDGGLTPLR